MELGIAPFTSLYRKLANLSTLKYDVFDDEASNLSARFSNLAII
jgi:hypothetical protein